MAASAAELLVDTLIEWEVDTIFGIPGDGINGIIEALRQKKDSIRFVQVRHEEAAAFMACAYAKWTGKLGIQSRRQDRRHQEQHARPDQMGADGVPRQPGICLPAAADRLRRRRAGIRRNQLYDRGSVNLWRHPARGAGDARPGAGQAVVDPHEPPMPPKVSVKPAAKFAKALASGTPNAGKITLTVASETVRELIDAAGQ
jgi:hypothetical protein